MPAPVSLPSLALGARVQDTLLVWDVETRTQADGNAFVILQLQNSSGRIATAPFWSDQLHQVEGLTRGVAVSVIGEVQSYRGGRQLKVSSIRALPAAQTDYARLLPSEGDVAPWWAAVDKALGEMADGPWKRAVLLFYADPDFRRRYEQCPGSTNNHHATLGGLLRHTVEVARIAWAIARNTTGADWDQVLAGVLLHDIGKLQAYRWDGVFEKTEPGHLLGHVALGSLMLDARLDELDPPLTQRESWLLQHLVLSHHGELAFGSPVQPMTVEAEILHQADHASATSTNFADALRDPANFEGGALVSKRIWSLERRVFRATPDREGGPDAR